MAINTLQDKLLQAIQLIEEVRQDLNTPTVYIGLGDNLQNKLADISEGTRVIIPTNFFWTGSLKIPKPCQLVGGNILGSIRFDAPDISIKALSLVGAYPNDTLVVTNSRSLIEDSFITGSLNGQRRGILVNSEGVKILRTTVDNIWHKEDSQAIAGWNGTKNLLIENCPLLEASGENIMFGGADSTSFSDIPSGITIRRCHLHKPLSWRYRNDLTVKNLFELKCAKNVLVEDVSMENSWVHGQNGFGVVLTVRNQDGTSPWSTIEDVTMQRISIKSVAGGVQILGKDDTYISETMKRVTLKDWSIIDLSPNFGRNQRTFQFAGQGENINLENIVVNAPIIPHSALTFSGKPVKNLSVKGCNFDEGEYGISGDNTGLGVIALDTYALGYVWSDNLIRTRRSETGRVINYPSGTTII